MPRWHDDPTGDLATDRAGDKTLDNAAAAIPRLQLTMLMEKAAGLSPSQIASKHQVPELIVRYAAGSAALRLNSLLQGWRFNDQSDPDGLDGGRSVLLRQLELSAAPRCHHCQQVLRDGEQPRPGRRMQFCGPVCRSAVRRHGRSRLWQEGYLGSHAWAVTGTGLGDDPVLAPDGSGDQFKIVEQRKAGDRYQVVGAVSIERIIPGMRVRLTAAVARTLQGPNAMDIDGYPFTLSRAAGLVACAVGHVANHLHHTEQIRRFSIMATAHEIPLLASRGFFPTQIYDRRSGRLEVVGDVYLGNRFGKRHEEPAAGNHYQISVLYKKPIQPESVGSWRLEHNEQVRHSATHILA